MRCDKCEHKDATIFITQVVDGHTTKIALCATCGEPFTQAAASFPQFMEYLQGGRFPASPFVDLFAEVADHDARYTREAFWFVRDGVDHAIRSHSGDARHVTAHELLASLRILALERYGSGAREQLRSWGVTRCEDFGEIVFALIGKGAFGKRPEDRKEDFNNGYDFASAFPIATP
ncbi:MAG: hypothetical protein H0X40_18785 [Chthoniobacterales bacterium]|nr:hypothetical protein [Chthoniobacterales bacterium]